MSDTVTLPTVEERLRLIRADDRKVVAGVNPVLDERRFLLQCLQSVEAELARITNDRDAKSARMWELGKQCDALEADLAKTRDDLQATQCAEQMLRDDLARARSEIDEQTKREMRARCSRCGHSLFTLEKA